jgi:hypothetical protein
VGQTVGSVLVIVWMYNNIAAKAVVRSFLFIVLEVFFKVGGEGMGNGERGEGEQWCGWGGGIRGRRPGRGGCGGGGWGGGGVFLGEGVPVNVWCAGVRVG